MPIWNGLGSGLTRSKPMVLTRIAAHPITRLAELLPHNWKPAQV
jgi:hypothetical protein